MILHRAAEPSNVLVVEDELMLRMGAVNIVEDAGFTAIEAVAPMRLSQSSDPARMSTSVHRYSDAGSMDGLMLATPSTSAGHA